MSNHTPGPWAVTTRRGSWDWVVFCERASHLEICQPFHDGTALNETGEANARLIAAAPEMLEALKEAARLLDQTDMGDSFIQAVIAKAEGRP